MSLKNLMKFSQSFIEAQREALALAMSAALKNQREECEAILIARSEAINASDERSAEARLIESRYLLSLRKLSAQRLLSSLAIDMQAINAAEDRAQLQAENASAKHESKMSIEELQALIEAKQEQELELEALADASQE